MCFTYLYTYSSMSILFAHFVYLHYSYKQSCNYVLPAAVSCGPAPKAPANGQRRGSGTTFGSTVTYSCNPGYILQGDNRRTCMADRQWSGVTTHCSRKLTKFAKQVHKMLQMCEANVRVHAYQQYWCQAGIV